MHPTIALVLWLVLLSALLRYDPARESKVSWAVWVPVLWMFFMLSRLPSQWLGRTIGTAAEAFEEGNSLDRVVLFGLILLSVGILVRRSFRWGEFFGKNLFLSALLFYGLVSFMWSDFSSIALKRWIRDLGNYLVILVVLTETQPLEAVGVYLRRLFYGVIPLSILMIKYYSYTAVHYSFWTGLPEYVGVATSKNTLGVACMLSGIFFFWDTVTRWSNRKDMQTKRIILVNIAFIAMSVWLLRLANSATSQVCLVLGCVAIMAFKKWGESRPSFLKTLIPVFLCGYVILAIGFGLNDTVARMLGRDPSLTGRIDIWKAVLNVNINPLVGTGYDSFWLGSRLWEVWGTAGPVNQAHNGYLEFYLNLGFIGVFLLVGFLISSYLKIWKNLTQFRNLGSLALALWTLALFYNITEASFKPTFVCLTFLIGAVIMPQGQLARGVQRPLQSRALPGAARSPVLSKWQANRLRQQGQLKPDHD